MQPPLASAPLFLCLSRLLVWAKAGQLSQRERDQPNSWPDCATEAGQCPCLGPSRRRPANDLMRSSGPLMRPQEAGRISGLKLLLPLLCVLLRCSLLRAGCLLAACCFVRPNMQLHAGTCKMIDYCLFLLGRAKTLSASVQPFRLGLQWLAPQAQTWAHFASKKRKGRSSSCKQCASDAKGGPQMGPK